MSTKQTPNNPQDPLLQIRRKLSIFSLGRSHQRIKAQQHQISTKDQIQIDQEIDALVQRSLHFQGLSTLYGDGSVLVRGRFDQMGGLFFTAAASGEALVWGRDGEGGDWGKITALKGVDKVCDVAAHPNIGNIPAFAPNIITGTNTGNIFVWTFDPTLPTQKSIKIQAHKDRISSTAFHQSGCMFLTSSYDKSWSIWDTHRLKQLSNQKGHNTQIHTSSIHPDGSLFLTGDLSGDAMVWDLRTGQGIYQISTTNSIVCSAFHPNGFEFVVGGKNNMIHVYDLRRKKQVKVIPAHLKLVSDLQYSGDGALLFSAGHDRVVRMWHGRSYCSVGSQLEHASKISSISYSDGTLAVTMIDKKFTMWTNKPVSAPKQLHENEGQIKVEMQAE